MTEGRWGEQELKSCGTCQTDSAAGGSEEVLYREITVQVKRVPLGFLRHWDYDELRWTGTHSLVCSEVMVNIYEIWTAPKRRVEHNCSRCMEQRVLNSFLSRRHLAFVREDLRSSNDKLRKLDRIAIVLLCAYWPTNKKKQGGGGRGGRGGSGGRGGKKKKAAVTRRIFSRSPVVQRLLKMA